MTSDSKRCIELIKAKPEVGSPQGSILSPCFWLHQASTSYYQFDKSKEKLLLAKQTENVSLKGFADDNCHQISLIRSELGKGKEELIKVKQALADTLKVFEDCIEATGGILNQKKTEYIYHTEDKSLEL